MDYARCLDTVFVAEVVVGWKDGEMLVGGVLQKHYRILLLVLLRSTAGLEYFNVNSFGGVLFFV